ncbi:MAG: amidohydrolase [Clostridia bacterium]|nr:amidohydrolase [Clostridia bacterium]
MKLYKNCRIITCADKDFENGYILTDNGKISGIGDMKDMPECENALDLKGKTVCPGFVDAHSHIGLFHDSESYDMADANESTDAVTPHLRAIDGINPLDRCFREALLSGVTTVAAGPGSANPIGGTFAVLKTAGKRIDDMVINSSAAMKFAFGENPKKCHGKGGSAPKTRMATAAVIREALFKAKNYDGTSFDMKCEALKPVVDGKMLVKAHAHRADDIFTAIRIAKEFGLCMTIEHCTDGALIADELKKENVAVILGPLMGDRGKPELCNKSYETARALYKAGLSFALMSDHPEVTESDLLMQAQLLVKHGVPGKEALYAITINAAKAIGAEDRVGTLEDGKDADFCVFTGDPLSFDGKINFVVCSGVEYRA